LSSPTPKVDKRNILKVGNAYYINIPAEWFEANNLKPEEIKKLLLVMDKDIRIVNPEHEREVYEEISRLVKEAKL